MPVVEPAFRTGHGVDSRYDAAKLAEIAAQGLCIRGIRPCRYGATDRLKKVSYRWVFLSAQCPVLEFGNGDFPTLVGQSGVDGCRLLGSRGTIGRAQLKPLSPLGELDQHLEFIHRAVPAFAVNPNKSGSIPRNAGPRPLHTTQHFTILPEKHFTGFVTGP